MNHVMLPLPSPGRHTKTPHSKPFEKKTKGAKFIKATRPNFAHNIAPRPDLSLSAANLGLANRDLFPSHAIQLKRR